MIRPVDIAALNLLTDHDEVVTSINALMQVEHTEDNDEKSSFLTPENPGNEKEHSLIQKLIPKELRELSKREKLDPTEKNLETNSFRCSNRPTH